MDIEFVEGNQELLDWISPLWVKLNAFHRHKTHFFMGYYSRLTFPQRKAILLARAHNGMMRVDLVRLKETDQYIAYSVTTISEKREGEIASLFVDESYRLMGIGDSLMRRALEWLDRHLIKVRQVAIADGNDEAINFYQRYGFFPKTIVLEQVDRKTVPQLEGASEAKKGSARGRKKK